MKRKSVVFHNVTHDNVIYVAPGKQKAGLSRGNRHPPIMYFLDDVLLAVKLSEVVVDLSRRAQLVPHHYDVPHLGSDVWCVVVGLQKCCPVDLLVGPTSKKRCELSLGFRFAIIGSRNVTVCDCLDCRSTRGSFLGNILGGTICTSDAGDDMT